MNAIKIIVDMEEYIGVEPNVETSAFTQGVRQGQRRLLSNLKFAIVQEAKYYTTLSDLEDDLNTERSRRKSHYKLNSK